MRKSIVLIGVFGHLMLCYSMKAQQSDNLHKTVIHGENNSATMPIVNNSHTEKTMPQNDKDFGDYKGLVSIFKYYITEKLPELDKKGLNHGIYLPHGYDYKQWTQEDLTNLAVTYNGIEMFESLIVMKNGAVDKDADGNYTPKALCAQNALTELKPNGCKSWKGFFNMIETVQRETDEKRAAIKQRKQDEKNKGKSGAVFDLHKNDAICGDPMENPAFDQQAALQTLKDREIVLTDANAGQKKPLETAVTDAVKAIKGAVRAA